MDKVILFLESDQAHLEGRARLLRIEHLGKQDQIKVLFNKLRKHFEEDKDETGSEENKSTLHNLNHSNPVAMT